MHAFLRKMKFQAIFALAAVFLLALPSVADAQSTGTVRFRVAKAGFIFGVGVGHYFDRSSEFMPEELRRIYGNENAHNYFAQQFAEVGVVGGLLFIWLIVLGYYMDRFIYSRWLKQQQG